MIEQEFSSAGVSRPQYGITGWVILTLVQHTSEDQVARWVLPALRQEVIWCQLFSEPDAGSDAAGIKTRATRVDGGWLVSGQKVWTSGAHVASLGLATTRTDPDTPKHQGITMMVIDMHAPRVEVRPLRMVTGHSEFNEVFFNDVFVPDDDVVGPVDRGWTVARATLGNESVSIGGGAGGGGGIPAESVIALFDAHPERLGGGAGRIGRFMAAPEAMAVLNMRSAHRAVVGGGPGPEGNVTKLVLTEIGHEAAANTTRAGRIRDGLRRRRRLPGGGHGPDAPRHVDRRRHLGDQAQPDRRAHPRPAPGPAHQLNGFATPALLLRLRTLRRASRWPHGPGWPMSGDPPTPSTPMLFAPCTASVTPLVEGRSHRRSPARDRRPGRIVRDRCCRDLQFLHHGALRALGESRRHRIALLERGPGVRPDDPICGQSRALLELDHRRTGLRAKLPSICVWSLSRSRRTRRYWAQRTS